MNESERPPLWLPPISLLVMGLIVWRVSLSSPALIPLTVTGQAFLLFVVLRTFCYWPPMVRWVGTMPAPHRVIFAVMIGGMILGHFTLTSRAYFPYVSWFIFPTVREENPVTCREFIATTASGKKVRLLVEQLYPSIVQLYPLDDLSHYPPNKVDLLVRSMVKSYSARHSSDPVRSVDFVSMSVQLHPSTGESHAQPSCQLLKRYDISSGL